MQFDTDFKRELEDEYFFDKICERVSTDNPCIMDEYALGFWLNANHEVDFDSKSPY